MIRYLSSLILLLSVMGCQSKSRKYPQTIPTTKYDILLVDGCEYIKIGSGNFQMMAHKGNCTNPIHVYSNQKAEK